MTRAQRIVLAVARRKRRTMPMPLFHRELDEYPVKWMSMFEQFTYDHSSRQWQFYPRFDEDSR